MFGIKRSEHTRKPKKIHARVKKLYGQHLEKHWDAKYSSKIYSKTLTNEERLEIRSRVIDDIKKENQLKFRKVIISLILTLIFLFALVRGIGLWFSF